MQVTSQLRTPNGTQRLLPIQAQALVEIAQAKGLFGPIGVGEGKTLVTLLAPVVLGAKQPLLLLPASLVDKTAREMREVYSKHWKIARNLRLLSYEMLGRAQAAEQLTHWAPDLIVGDEIHRLKNPKAAVTRRVTRYLEQNPKTMLVGLSGTILGESILDFAHILIWALKGKAPVPLDLDELKEWAACLDEQQRGLVRFSPGPLLEWAKPSDTPTDEVTAARQAFRNRLLETPGVVATAGEQVIGCSLRITGTIYPVKDVTNEHIGNLRNNMVLPCGWPVVGPLDVWRHARELALGFHYVWDPRPPKAWLDARKNWAAFARECLKEYPTLDSEKQVKDACDRGEIDGCLLEAWRKVYPTFQVNLKPIWHDESAMVAVDKWLQDGPGIVWVEHSWFGRQLAKATGLPYFGQKGLDDTGRSILSCDGKTPIIASERANGTGHNLQMFNRMLMTSVTTKGKTLEQTLGREHRTGQRADEVTCDILVGCTEHWEAFQHCQKEAQMSLATLGQRQRVLYADILFPSDLDLVRAGGYRFAKGAKKYELGEEFSLDNPTGLELESWELGLSE